MSEFIIIWLLVVVENISGMLISAGSWFTLLLFTLIAIVVAPNVLASNAEKAGDIRVNLKTTRRWLVVLTVGALLCNTAGSLLPTKKELAIIIGAGTTYKVLTSDEAKAVGGKSIELINKKLDEMINNDTKMDEVTEAAKEVALKESKKVLAKALEENVE